ncbi:MAG: nicotinate (nicotinamide) nucleotide adenylyltransferase [Eubacteriales bacterium]|nr:nicotinate (nicotinamide) nucleotide adenylyltransferase [Eubacteriales bacterium]
MQEKMDKKRKIVVMGGSFNPPTVAHERIMMAAVNALNADGGIFVPSSDAYVTRKMKRQRRENEVLSEGQRAQMLRAMCARDERLSVDECEFQDDGRGHTFETLQKLQEKNPDATLYFLIGGDKLNIITRWGNQDALFEQFRFAVMKRDGTEPEQQIQQNPCLEKNRHIFYMIPEPDGIEGISSTALRDKMRLGDASAAELVNEEVWNMLVEAGWLKTEICSFREEYAFLSNFYGAPIEYRGIYYLNNEAAFQAQKCMTEEEKWQFAQLPAGKAKRRGRQVQLRKDWEEVKVSFMEEIVRAKFSQHPELAERLLATGDRKLVEGNTWNDTFWGVDVRTGKGQNHLGEILMKIRDELKAKEI